MSKFKKSSEPSNEWKPSRADVDWLRSQMLSFEPKVINGTRWYPFELYMQSIGVLKPDKHGRRIVCSPADYHRNLAIHDFHCEEREKELDIDLERYPEEKVKYDGRIKQLKQSIRELLGFKKAEQGGYKLKRSALIEYEKKYNKPYEVPEGTLIDEES